MNEDLFKARSLLNDWADWLLGPGGYPHRSSIDLFRDGWGRGGGAFGSSPPKDVEPNRAVARASRAMQHLRVLEGDKALLLTEVYLSRQSIPTIADARQLSIPQCRTLVRHAERSFLELYDMIALTDGHVTHRVSM